MKQKAERSDSALTRPQSSPLHDGLGAPVTVQASELALVLLHCGCNTIGEVLPAVCDHVPGDAVLGCEGTGAGAQPGQTGQVGAQSQIQGDAGAVDTEL